MTNENLAKTFDALGMPSAARIARDGGDMTRSIISMLGIHKGNGADMHGDAALILTAARSDGYDVDAIDASLKSAWITMPYSVQT